MLDKIRQAMPYLQCVHCNGSLTIRSVDVRDVLQCESCAKEYQIKDGIPILLKNQAGETYYDIPWHPVSVSGGVSKSIKSRAKNWVVSIPFMKLLVYKVLYGPNKLFLTEEVNKLIKEGAIVADIGCRNIPYVGALDRLKTYLAIDIDFTSLQYIQSLNYRNVVPILASIDDMPLRSGSVDSAICLEVIEHVENDRKAISELGRILRKNGILFLTTPDGDTVSVEELPLPRLHLRHYKRGELSEYLVQNFNSVKIESIASWFPFWRVADGIETAVRKEGNKVKKLVLILIFYTCNFLSNILHAISERTAYKSKGHYRFVAKCAK